MMLCQAIADIPFIINSDIVASDKIKLQLCCYNPGHGGPPWTVLDSSPQSSLDRLFKMRNDLVDECNIGKGNLLNQFGCMHCAQMQEWKGNILKFINMVNLSVYPSPCQSKCVYCMPRNWIEGKETRERYKKILETVLYADNNGYIDDDALWIIASGEITIHPLKRSIMDLAQNKKCRYLTNCFIYDDEIAHELRVNEKAAINLSIDSGTPETWEKVKGVNNFEEVLDNLKRYSESAISPEQITLKYIILPGINDNDADYLGIVAIMKELNIHKLVISKDLRTRSARGDKELSRLMYPVLKLSYECKKNGIMYELEHYFNDQIEYLHKLLEKWSGD